jgi:hypothetical protein
MPSWDQLFQEIASGPLPRVEESPGDLGDATGQFLAVLYTDPQWDVVRRTLEQMAADHSIDGILDRTQEAMAGIQNSLRPGHWYVIKRCIGSLGTTPTEKTIETELAKAETDLRERLPEIAEKLSQVERAAEKIAADPEKSKTAERISRAIKNSAASKLSPIALLVMLWWLFVVAFPKDTGNDVAVLALWYAVARDSWKKDD